MHLQTQKKNFESQSKHFGFLLSIIFLIFAIYIIVNKSVLLGQLLLILGGTFDRHSSTFKTFKWGKVHESNAQFCYGGIPRAGSKPKEQSVYISN